MDSPSMIAMAEAVPLPILLVTPQERIHSANAAARALFGETLAGRAFVTVLRQPAIGDALEAVLRRGESVRVRVRITAAGREIVALATAAPMPADHSCGLATGGAILTLEDITALEEAEAMRRDFVANVSHELRTPLTALMGFIETLRGAAKDDPVARDRFLNIMEREAGRMNRLVGDLLSLSRVESDERRKPTGAVDLGVLLRSVAQTLQPMADAAGVALLREGETGNLTCPGDQDQLVQVFSNLVENAIKYGASGGEVRILVTRIEHEPVLRGAAYKVTVADRGDGIEAMHLPRLTERFYRVDTHRSREQGGTGLGLAIVKHIVARHRGRLKIESEKGQGSRFSVILPAA